MTPQESLDKIASLAQKMMLDDDPDTHHMGVALLALPITASEDMDDFNELLHLIFMFVKVKASQRTAIKNLLDPSLN